MAFSRRRLMASYAGHISLAAALGAAYGSAGAFYYQLDWGPAILAAGLTTVGGMLPDLDSQSGVPVREMFGLAAIVGPLLLVPRMVHMDLSSSGISLQMSSDDLQFIVGCTTACRQC